MRDIKSKITIMLIIMIIAGCNNSVNNNKKNPLDKWLPKNSYKIDTLELTDKQNDLFPLKHIIGNAEVVCLGENRHDIHEQFLLKHRFIKYFVEELGFKTFILEASLPYSKLINEYILTENGNIDEILANMPGWFLWDTQEISNIINWIRNYNSRPENTEKIQFYGIDIVAPNYGLSQIFDYLKKVDTKSLKDFQNKTFAQDIINDSNWQSSLQAYGKFTTEEKQILHENIMNYMNN